MPPSDPGRLVAEQNIRASKFTLNLVKPNIRMYYEQFQSRQVINDKYCKQQVINLNGNLKLKRPE